MEVTGPTVVSVAEPSQVSDARRSGVALAAALDFDETSAGRVALVITEAGTNLVKHAGGGDVVLRGGGRAPGAWVELLALDRGPGMPNVARCLEDGFSTSGSPGTGLGAVKRLASTFDVYSRPGLGTALLARVNGSTGRPPRPRTLEVEGLCIAKPGEEVCGDAFAEDPRADGTSLIVVDGLGHGASAADAARVAVAAFREAVGRRPAVRLERVHQALRATRGAAVAVADLDLAAQVVRFAGLGNIAGRIVHEDGAAEHMVSQPGTAGHLARAIHEYTYRWPPGAVVVLHSDGVTAHYDLTRYPGLTQRHPALIAGVLLRDAARGRDDATVVVARARA